MTQRLKYLPILIFLAGGAVAGEEAKSETIPLKWVVLDKAPVGLWEQDVKLNEHRFGEMNFATPSGKLRFRSEGDDGVCIDRNDDGVFDEKDRPFAQKDRPTTVTIRTGSQSLDYRLTLTERVVLSPSKTWQALYVTSLTALEGTVGARRVRILDANIDGRFGDLGENGEASDKLQVDDEPAIPLQRHLLFDGRLLGIEVLAKEQTLRLTPHTGPLATLTFAVKPGFEVTTSLEHNESGYRFNIEPRQTSVSRVGAHRVTYLSLCSDGPPVEAELRVGDNTALVVERPVLILRGTNEQPEFQLKEGRNEPVLGPPLKMEFRAVCSPKNAALVEIRGVWLTGVGGERYRARNDGDGDDSVLQSLLRDGEKARDLSKLSYG